MSAFSLASSAKSDLQRLRDFARSDAHDVPAKEKLYEIVYEEGKRAITQQISALDALHSRVGTVFSAASVSTAFLGGVALKKGVFTIWTWCAIGCFVVLSLLLLSVVLARAKWTFHMSPEALLKDYVEMDQPTDLATFYRKIAIYSELYFKRDYDTLRRLAWRFNTAVAILAVEVILWLVDLGTR